MPLSYVTTATVKTRLGITDTTDDTLIGTLVDQVNAFVESYTGRQIGPWATASTFSFHHFPKDVDDLGRIFPFPQGLSSLTTLEVRDYTGGTLTTVPATDWYLWPQAQQRDPGWPATEIHMTDVPSASNGQPFFAAGYETVRLTGNFGWSAIPADVTELAINLALALWRSRAAGTSDVFTIGPEGERTFERALSDKDRHTLNRYRRREVLFP